MRHTRSGIRRHLCHRPRRWRISKWRGATGGYPAEREMRAHFAVVLALRDGRITAQRNYDCFYPFSNPPSDRSSYPPANER